ncbi:efflux RND transporter periplasmic adaptor subunit [Flavihumibacter solisilvae]|uniref:RND transporter n=1 Tax=Flavihumibacter solisilvae TaxID=1349421 RepID=A0A0C1L306_9BACT|nr:efflux RND transporter periplasmic adaptor subunit [Flavihumibacter solisilvae]KIC93966.1 RND transporter [Flavihumibacter solisilvae]
MKKVITIGITIAVIIVSLGAIAKVLSNNKKKSEEKTKIVAQSNAAVAVRVTAATWEVPSLDVISNGTFTPAQELSLASEKSGRIVQVLVDEGSYVQKGQTVATIRVDQLSVDMRNAEANFQTAQADLQRYENAFKTGGVTQQQLDQARLGLENTKAKLDQARINLGDASIRATISGVVNKRHIEPGTVVSPGTALFDIVNVSSLKLMVMVNEAQVANLQTSQQVKVKASVFPDKLFNGKISFIAPKADAALNFPVEIIITNNAGNQLRAGMYGTAVFDFPNQAATTMIPRTAFVGSVNSRQVFVPENGVARLKSVIPGRVIGDKVEVLEGISKGTPVITSGQINLVDGSKVNIIQ